MPHAPNPHIWVKHPFYVLTPKAVPVTFMATAPVFPALATWKGPDKTAAKRERILLPAFASHRAVGQAPRLLCLLQVPKRSDPGVCLLGREAVLGGATVARRPLACPPQTGKRVGLPDKIQNTH